MEDLNMITLFVFMIMLLLGIVGLAIRLSWGFIKFVLGLGLFWFCPLLFVLAVVFGFFSHMWLPILIIGLLFGGMFRRAL